MSGRRMRVVVIGKSDGLAGRLASHYRSSGAAAEVLAISGVGADSLGTEALDVLILADEFEPPDRRAEEVGRSELQAAALRLSYEPFRIALLARPVLRKAGGRAVLLTRGSARMEHEDRLGRYLERPFRAASHTLWRCFSCEWRAEGIETTVIALEGVNEPAQRIIEAIEAYRSPEAGVELIDTEGRVLGW